MVSVQKPTLLVYKLIMCSQNACLCKSIGQTNGKQSKGEKAKRRKRWKWEEKNGTYNPDASLMQSQASPWSSALAEAAQRSLGLGNGIPTHKHTTGGRQRRMRGRITGRVGGGTKTGTRKQRDKHDWEDKQMEGKTEWFSEMRKPDWLWGCTETATFSCWPLTFKLIHHPWSGQLCNHLI